MDGYRDRGASWRGASLFLLATLVAVGLVWYLFGRTDQAPATVDGLRVMTVSEALAAHAAGALPGDRVAVRGFWSASLVGHMCAAPAAGQVPGELELYCNADEFGITELPEAIFLVDMQSNVVTEAKGPHLTPWIPTGFPNGEALFTGLPGAREVPPTPILVTGHFNDPLAAQCRPQAVQLCVDRLVLDRLVQLLR